MPVTLAPTPANVLASFIRGAAVVGEHPSEEIISSKLAAIQQANPRKRVGYAFMCGRNWALDQRERKASQARQQARQLARLAEADAAKARAEAHEAAMRSELYDVIDLMEQSARLDGRVALYRYANALRLAYLLNLPASKWSALYPQLSVNGLQQVKCRAVKCAAEHAASPALMRWLKRRVD